MNAVPAREECLHTFGKRDARHLEARDILIFITTVAADRNQPLPVAWQCLNFLPEPQRQDRCARPWIASACTSAVASRIRPFTQQPGFRHRRLTTGTSHEGGLNLTGVRLHLSVSCDVLLPAQALVESA